MIFIKEIIIVYGSKLRVSNGSKLRVSSSHNQTQWDICAVAVDDFDLSCKKLSWTE